MSGIDSGERLLTCGDLNGHMGSEIDGFEGVHGDFGFGKRNVEACVQSALTYGTETWAMKKSTLRFISFRDTPRIHLTIIRSVLSRLCRFSFFIP